MAFKVNKRSALGPSIFVRQSARLCIITLHMVSTLHIRQDIRRVGPTLKFEKKKEKRKDVGLPEQPGPARKCERGWMERKYFRFGFFFASLQLTFVSIARQEAILMNRRSERIQKLVEVRKKARSLFLFFSGRYYSGIRTCDKWKSICV